jgi:hypothetical protein
MVKAYKKIHEQAAESNAGKLEGRDAMRHFKLFALLLGAWLGFTAPAGAQLMPQTAYSDSQANTALGQDALPSDIDTGSCNSSSPCGSNNTATGSMALESNTTGSYNSAFGSGALAEDTTGSENTAFGAGALHGPENGSLTGSNNTAVGYHALNLNQIGINNTALGFEALSNNMGKDGYGGSNNNTATGFRALAANSSGGSNTASGSYALYSNAGGNNNTATGFEALSYNSTGENNVATGAGALSNYSGTGSYNTATGYMALSSSSGSYNIAEGPEAGEYLTTGNYNIEIGSPGKADDNHVIRIGNTQSANIQSATYIAGIFNATVTGTGYPVVVSADGQLGYTGSSERFKTEITPMGEITGKLDELRPVTFRYKSEPHGARQYGLIAEEVAKVYPELVVRDANGQVTSVRYDELGPMLLNVVQKQEQRAIEQAAEIRELKAAVSALQASQHD